MSDTEKNTETKVSSAQLRKIKKPIIERRRRERINESLNQLKSLVLDALNKDESRFSKMEKADILEMTVKHLKTVHQQHTSSSSSSISNRYTAGFHECAQEVSRYLGCMGTTLNPEVQNRLMNHLTTVAHKSGSNNGTSATAVPIQPATNATTLQVHQSTNVPSATQTMALPGLPIAALSTQGAQVLPVFSSAGGIPTVNVSSGAIPITVPAGGVVTILPTADENGNKTSVSIATAPDGKPNVIPLYVNTGIQLSSPSPSANQNYLGSSGSLSSSPGSSPSSSTGSSPSSTMYNHSKAEPPSQHLSCSPKTGDEAPVQQHLHMMHQGAHAPDMKQQSAPALAPRSHTVISHTQTVLQSNVYSQDCRSALQQPGLPMQGQNPGFFHAEIVNGKEPVWRPW